MKDAEWDKLTPRQRDAKVGELLDLPFTAVSRQSDGEVWAELYHTDNFTKQEIETRIWHENKGGDEFPPYKAEAKNGYATTYEGFGLVVEAMRAKGWYLVLMSLGLEDGHKWCADWSGPGGVLGSGKVANALADSAPEAVALAAVRAMEAK